MSGSLNEIQLIGNLGSDPEVKAMPSGDKVANFSVATSERWKDKATGADKEKTEWTRIVVWGKLADIVEKYLKKGSKVYVKGALQTRKWQDASGQDKYSTEVVLRGFDSKMIMLDGAKSASQMATVPTETAPSTGVDDSEIPF